MKNQKRTPASRWMKLTTFITCGKCGHRNTFRNGELQICVNCGRNWSKPK